MNTPLQLKTEVICFVSPISGNRFYPPKFLNKRSINLVPRILWGLKKTVPNLREQNTYQIHHFLVPFRSYVLRSGQKVMLPFTLVNNAMLVFRVGKCHWQITGLSTSLFLNALWQGRLFEMRSQGMPCRWKAPLVLRQIDVYLIHKFWPGWQWVE